MTNHLTPGAMALLDGKEVVEILNQHEQYPAWHWVSNANRHHDEPVFVDRLTPLLTAVVQEDGTVREVNPLGKHPRDYMIEDRPNRDAFEQYEDDYKAAESQRRTWDGIGKCEAQCKDCNGVKFDCTTPGTTVLGYEKDSKFIIVKIQTP